MLPIGPDYASIDRNAPPDFVSALAAGARFAIVRGTYSDWVDPTWKRDHDAIKAAGLVAGAYLFCLPGPAHPSPEEQVAAFVAAIGLERGKDLPPAADVEFPGGVAKTGLSRADLLAWVRRFVGALRKAYGVDPLIYSSARAIDGDDSDSLSIPTLHVSIPDLTSCPLWLARYPYKERTPAVFGPSVVAGMAWPPVPKEWGDGTNVWIHQYQGDAIGFPGFSLQVDLSRFFTMSMGARGDRVRWVQRHLGQAEGTPGAFDHVMDDAVRWFQHDRGLVADGIIGPRTFAALCWQPVAPR